MKQTLSPRSTKYPFTLYIIHGWMFDLKHWQPALDVFKKLKIKYKIFKIPGLTTKDTEIHTIDDYVKWLDKKWAKEDQVVVLAHSNGGRIALNYCLKHPQKIRHLILLNSAGIPPTIGRRLYYIFLEIVVKIIFTLKKMHIFKGTLYKLLSTTYYHKSQPHLKATLNNLKASDRNLKKKLPQITNPISILWGRKDRLTTLREGRLFKKKLPNVVRFIVLPKIGHSPYSLKDQSAVLGNNIFKILNNL